VLQAQRPPRQGRARTTTSCAVSYSRGLDGSQMGKRARWRTRWQTRDGYERTDRGVVLHSIVRYDTTYRVARVVSSRTVLRSYRHDTTRNNIVQHDVASHDTASYNTCIVDCTNLHELSSFPRVGTNRSNVVVKRALDRVRARPSIFAIHDVGGRVRQGEDVIEFSCVSTKQSCSS
jgi:hypothetical protein